MLEGKDTEYVQTEMDGETQGCQGDGQALLLALSTNRVQAVAD